ncbi:B-4DMT family transporter [Mycobacterium sp.]|uniref:B-4DMT family transporter n=1 Tax=Mycobacterium sp. TaxID=1785 RepID=UPI0031D97A62
MTTWMLRGLVFAAAMIVDRLFQGALINAFPTQAGSISVVLLAFFVAAVVVWGVIDGRADAAAHPDPDRRDDLALRWLLAGLLAGVVSGVVVWLISLLYQGIYAGGLLNEITTFASFTALLVLVTGLGGATAGRWLTDRNPPPVPHLGGDGEERADTDVFAAVRPDVAAAANGAATQLQTAPVATAEYEEPSAPPAYSESPTEEIQLSDIEVPPEAEPTADSETDQP